MEDWLAQTSDAPCTHSPDLIGEAGEKLWQAISERGLSYAKAFHQLEKQVIEAALRTCGASRRDVAKRLQTSERTLYHKIRAHHLSRRNVA
jgi:DNA-binding NtrC family response regulator